LQTPFVLIGNNEYAITGIHIGERTRLDTGCLSAYVAPRVHTRDLPKLVARALFGNVNEKNGLRVSTTAELWVESLFGQTMKVACDGEVITIKSPLHFRSRPGALNVIVPCE
jgi:diacylglycerol kinase family enzyme